ncbi:DUF6113 family protein [Streptomyces sp. NPDC005925]|uniref:DUF6113 family protein n=1 Tax=Streptomyces sp. NPDC005925 TaxID=3157172 RepID=UPI0033FBAFB4
MSDRTPAMARPLRPPAAGRAAAYLFLFLLGGVVALAGTLVQAAWFPGGLLLALAAEAGLCLGAARALNSRGGAAAAAGGWMLAVVLLTAGRPEGDFLFGASGGSYLFLLGGMAVAVICATLVPVRQPAAAPARLGK